MDRGAIELLQDNVAWDFKKDVWYEEQRQQEIPLPSIDPQIIVDTFDLPTVSGDCPALKAEHGLTFVLPMLDRSRWATRYRAASMGTSLMSTYTMQCQSSLFISVCGHDGLCV